MATARVEGRLFEAEESAGLDGDAGAPGGGPDRIGGLVWPASPMRRSDHDPVRQSRGANRHEVMV